jgi:hypothetical protein
MGKTNAALTPEQTALIENAPLFFVASADPALSVTEDGLGPVNLSPKGGVPLHVLSPERVAYLDYPGSGNETARHAMAGGPVTVMVCSFEEGDAAIVRLYGTATVSQVDESPLGERLLRQAATDLTSPNPRQVVEVAIESTQTSCGYGVPVMAFQRERCREDRGRRYKG